MLSYRHKEISKGKKIIYDMRYRVIYSKYGYSSVI
jgi:hypothetical protein